MIAMSKFNGYAPDRRRLYFKGGGGGGGGPYYGQLEGLYGEQAASARLLRQQAEANLPAVTESYMGEVNQALNPAYADNQSKMAAADMASANAMERAATNRELASMGVNPNDARFVGANRAAETNNAARMAAGRNVARNDANKYQLAVAQDAVGTFTGQSNSASSQMSGATSGLSGLYSQQNAAKQNAAAQQSQNTANAVGGAMAAWSLLKDGGKVCGPRKGYGMKKVERHMLGGAAGAQQNTMKGFFQQQQVTPPPQMAAPAPQQQGPSMAQTISAAKKTKSAADGSGAATQTEKIGKLAGKFSNNAGNQIQSQAAGMRMDPAQAKEAAGAYREAANTAANPADAQSYLDAAANIEQGAGVEAATTPAAAEGGLSSTAPGVSAEVGGAASGAGSAGTAGTATAAAAEGGLSTVAPGVAGEVAGAASGLGSAGATAVGDAALTAAATEAGAATTAAATSTAAAGATGIGAAGAAIGAAMPWVGAAMAVGSLLELWSGGGEVGTQGAGDMTDAEARAQFDRAFAADEVNDMRGAGGKVPGEWQENVDTVPALLVEEEFVLPVESAALVGERDLEKLRGYGLKLRARGETPDTIRAVGLSRASSLAGGGK